MNGQSSFKTRMLWGVLAVLGAAGVLAIIGVLGNDSIPLADEMVGTSITIAIYSILILLATIVVPRFPRLGWGAIVALAVAGIVWLIVSWVGGQATMGDMFDLGMFAMVMTIPGIVLLHIGLLSLAKIDGPFGRAVRLGTMACSIVGGSVTMLAVVSMGSFGGLDQVAGVSILLAAIGTAAVPLASAIERAQATDDFERDVAKRTPVEVICPRCQTQSTIRAHTNGSCASCGLKIRIEVEEPRCACGYLLYNLTGDVCPECGGSIDAEQRWAGAEPTPGT